MERSIGGSIDALTLEQKGCPFELVDTCAGRCLDDDEHLEEELPELCGGDADFRVRHPHVEPMQDASASASADGGERAAMGAADATGATGPAGE